MTQIDTLLTTIATPLPRMSPKGTMDSQVDGTMEFAQIWSDQAENIAQKDLPTFLVEESVADLENPDLDNTRSADLMIEDKQIADNIIKTAPDPFPPQFTLAHDAAIPIRKGGVIETALTQQSAPLPVEANNTMLFTTTVPPLTLRSNATLTTSADAISMGVQPTMSQKQNPRIRQTDGLDKVDLSQMKTEPRNIHPFVARSNGPTADTAKADSQITPVLPNSMVPPALTAISGEQTEIDGILAPASPIFNAPSTNTPISAQPAYAPLVINQIAMAIVQSKGATTEIAINPEELGRVRIALTNSDAGLTVAILAERPETADLMRRNIEQLARELRDMGYENPTFTFGDQSGETSQDHDENSKHSGTTSALSIPAEDQPQASIRVALSGGLDLKL